MAFIPETGPPRSIRKKYAGGKSSLDGPARGKRSTYAQQPDLTDGMRSGFVRQSGAPRSIRHKYAKNVDRRGTTQRATPGKRPGEAGGPPLDVRPVITPPPAPPAPAPTALEAKLDLLLSLVTAGEAARLETQRQLDLLVHSKGNKGDLEPRVHAALVAAGEDAEAYFASNPSKDELRDKFGELVLGLSTTEEG